jgi:hypothetical protein
MIKNKPLWIITGIGIFATLVFLYLFVYNLATRTVESALLIEKAYPNIKPAEYLSELKNQAKKNHLKLEIIKNAGNTFILQIINEKRLEDVLSVSPQASLLAIVNVVIYDLGNGTGLVATNPYIWDIIYPSNYIDDIAESYSEELSTIFDSIYWIWKEKSKELD